MDAQAPSQGEAKGAVKGVPMGVQKAEAHRAIADFEKAFIDGPQSQPFVGESLAHEGTLPVHLQAALLGNATDFDIVAVL